MSEPTSAPPDTLEAIQAKYPDYRIWRSHTGSMWGATRRERVKGVDPTLIEDSPEQLLTKLETQAEIAKRRP